MAEKASYTYCCGVGKYKIWWKESTLKAQLSSVKKLLAWNSGILSIYGVLLWSNNNANLLQKSLSPLQGTSAAAGGLERSDKVITLTSIEFKSDEYSNYVLVT